VWLWPDREPVEVENASTQWLMNWARDRACYRIAS
jgi:hypothetical protein